MFLQESEFQAGRRAVERFQRLIQVRYRPLLRAVTENPKLRCEVHPSMAFTDSECVWLPVPFALGDETLEHDKNLCGERSPKTLKMLCPMCKVEDQADGMVLHESAHNTENTFDKVRPAVMRRKVLGEFSQELSALSDDHRKEVERRVAKAATAMEAANELDNWLGFAFNAVEDIYVNRRLFKKRPGAELPLKVFSREIFEEGIKQADGTVHGWKDNDESAQAIISGYLYGQGLAELAANLKPECDFTKDVEVMSLMDAIPNDCPVEERLQIAVKFLKRLRELGFCPPNSQSTLEPPPPPPPEDDDEYDEEDQDPDEYEDQSTPDKLGEGESESDEESDDDDAEPSGEGESESDEESDDDDAEPSGEGESESDDLGEEPDDGAASDGDDDDAEESDDDGEGSSGGSDDEEGDEDADASEDGDDGEAGDGDDDDGDEASEGGGDAEEEGGDEEGDSGDGEGEAGDSEADTDEGEADDGAPTQDGDVGDQGDVDDDDEGADDGSEGDGDDDGEEAGEADPIGNKEGDEGGGSTAEGSDEGDEPDEEPEPFDPVKNDAEIEEQRKRAEELLTYVMGHGDTEKGRPEASGNSDHEAMVLERVLLQEGFDHPSDTIESYKLLTRKDPTWSRTAPQGQRNTVPRSMLTPSLARLRVVFAENRKVGIERSLKRGTRLDTSHLHRAGTQDYRIFGNRNLPKTRDWFVLVGLDFSGSTAGNGADFATRMAGHAIGELLHQLGIRFAMYAHTSGSGSTYSFDVVEHVEIKGPEENWMAKGVQNTLFLQSGRGCNLDGHSLEQYRKIIEQERASDKMVMYFTDGEMPAMNFSEELALLQENIEILRRQRTHLYGVGYRTDSPTRHGLDTIQYNKPEDVRAIVEGLEARLR